MVKKRLMISRGQDLADGGWSLSRGAWVWKRGWRKRITKPFGIFSLDCECLENSQLCLSQSITHLCVLCFSCFYSSILGYREQLSIGIFLVVNSMTGFYVQVLFKCSLNNIWTIRHEIVPSYSQAYIQVICFQLWSHALKIKNTELM